MVVRLNIKQLTVSELPDGHLMTWTFNPASGLFVTYYDERHVTEDLMFDLREHTRHMQRSALWVATEHKSETVAIRFEHHDFEGVATVRPLMLPDQYLWLVDRHHYSKELLRETNEVLTHVAQLLARWDLVREPNEDPLAVRDRLSRATFNPRL